MQFATQIMLSLCVLNAFRLIEMKKHFIPVLLCAALAVCAGCAASTPSPESYGFRKEAITFGLKGDESLNQYQRRAHSLVLCLYQLKERSPFDQLLNESDGIGKLLECGRFDFSVANAKRMVIQPGQSLEQKFDRAEGVKHVAVVAGYYRQEKEGLSQVWDIPLEGWFSKKPAELEIRLRLGPQGIEKNAKPEEEKKQ